MNASKCGKGSKQCVSAKFKKLNGIKKVKHFIYKNLPLANSPSVAKNMDFKNWLMFVMCNWDALLIGGG